MNRQHLDSIFSFDTSRISDVTSEWLKNATSDEISLAINLGSTKVVLLKSSMSLMQKQQNDVAKVPTGLPSSVNTSVQTGQIGETFVESLLKKHFPVVTNVASQSKSGDLSLFIDHQKIVVEVKNYTNPVPNSGVEKFQRDLTTTNASGGIFISLRTPIVGVTSSYSMRFEYSGTKTVPCAYIVSSDESAIIVAVNMVSQMIGAMCHIGAEMSAKDKIVSTVYALSDKLDDLSRARNNLQVSVGEITNKLVKNSGEIISVEGGIRNLIDDIKSELGDVVVSDMQFVMMELEKNANFHKQKIETKDRVIEMMRKIHVSGPENITGTIWKLNGNKCFHCNGSPTSIWFQFYANHVDINLPHSKVDAGVVARLMSHIGNSFSMQSAGFSITIDSNTYDMLIEIIG